jgi:F0F1-type ATP synthase assembly protein I
MPFNRPIPESKASRTAATGLNALVQAETAIQIGLLPPSAVAICWLIGAALDRWLHQTWIAIAGIVFGAVAGLVGVVRMVLVLEKQPRLGKDAGAGSGKGSASS